MRFSSFKSAKKFAAVAAALMILPVAVACQSETADEAAVDSTTTEMPAETTETAPDATTDTTAAATGDTVVDVAAANGSFTTLVAAINAAGLAETLSGEGPFTVFAPTDDAFAALPDGLLDKLLLPENKEVLASILTYHVVAADVPSSAIEPGAVATVEGEDVTLAVEGTTVTVNEATVVQPDVIASNGVIHVIDAVLVPASVDVDALLAE